MNKMKNFSQTYYGHLNRTEIQHKANNIWFKGSLELARQQGEKGLYIPELKILFSLEGEPMLFDFVSGQGVSDCLKIQGLETPDANNENKGGLNG